MPKKKKKKTENKKESKTKREKLKNYQIYRGRREYQIKQMNYRATKKKKIK